MIGWGDYYDETDHSKGKHYPLHEDQLAIFNSTARFTAAIAGTGGGKTVVGPLWCYKKISELKEKVNRPFLGMIVAPTYKVLERATVPTLIDTFKGTYLEGIWKEQKHLYVLSDGSRIWCQGADNPGGIEGGQFDFVWGDEAGQFKYAVWVAIQGRTGARQSPILLTTTPYGKNWLYSHFYQKFLEGDEDYYVRQWASYKNPAYPKEEYERAKLTMSAEKAAMRYDGSFMQLEGLVYPDIHNCLVEMEPKDLFELLHKSGKFYGGIDYGWNDPFAALCGLLDDNDVLWIWYERYKSKTQIEDHAENLPQFPSRTIKWYSDNQPEYIIKLRKGGHKVKRANKSITVGIDAVNCRIQTGRLKIIRNLCPALISEAETYSYPSDEEDDLLNTDKPLGGFDHAMDALRYMIAGIDIRKAA